VAKIVIDVFQKTPDQDCSVHVTGLTVGITGGNTSDIKVLATSHFATRVNVFVRQVLFADPPLKEHFGKILLQWEYVEVTQKITLGSYQATKDVRVLCS